VFFFVSVSPKLLENNLLGASLWYNPDLGIGYVLIANLIANLITFLLLLKPYFGIFKKNEGEHYFDFQLWKKMMQYAGPLIIVGLAGIINEVLDRSLLKFMLQGSLDERLAQVGIYGACYKIAIFMNLLTQAFNYAAEPFFFKNSSKNDSKQLYADVALLFTFLASIVFLGVMLFMNIFQYFVSAPFREGIHIVPILLMANLFLGLYYIVSTWYKLTDKTKIGAVISIVGALATIIANIILIPIFGYTGAAWATLICYFVMLTLSYLSGKYLFPVPYSISRILFYIILSLIIFIIHQNTKIVFDKSLLLSFSYSTFFLAFYIVIILVMDGKYLLQIIKK
jgi:O-antigen/teichoic acid export membrane protein